MMADRGTATPAKPKATAAIGEFFKLARTFAFGLVIVGVGNWIESMARLETDLIGLDNERDNRDAWIILILSRKMLLLQETQIH